MPEYSYQTTSPDDMSQESPPSVIHGEFTVDGVSMRTECQGRAFEVFNPTHPHCPPLQSLGLFMGRSPNVTCKMKDSRRKYYITDRDMDGTDGNDEYISGYNDYFPTLQNALLKASRVWEMGPGLSEFPQYAHQRDIDYTAFDSAPYELIHAMCRCAQETEELREKADNRISFASYWEKRAAFMLTNNINLVRGSFPESLQEVMSEPKPDVIIDLNGPCVSLIDIDSIKGSKLDPTAESALMQSSELRTYISRLLSLLPKEGHLFLQLGNFKINIADTRNNVEELLKAAEAAAQ